MDLEATYERILQLGEEGGAGEKFLRLSRRYVADGIWKRGGTRVALFGRDFDGGTFLDFGSKFGHLTPVIKEMGAGAVINVDVDEEYLRDGARFIGAEYGASYVKSDDCYIDLGGGMVDFLLAKEAISHVNPTLLETFYSEAARVVRKGGEIIISDGNNLDLPDVAAGLLESYCEWEHGSGKELSSNFQTMRERMIAEAFPQLDADRIDYLARNTSGLHGDRLIATVRRATTGEFTERPHRHGQVPINPVLGTAMERGFYTAEVIMALHRHGFDAQLLPDTGIAFAVSGIRR